MFSSQDLTKVLSLIDGASVASRTTLVAIDGMGGAGKSTLAAQLLDAIDDSGVVSVDDFYRPMAASERAGLRPEGGYDRYFDWRRLRDSVLGPIRFGLCAQYRRYDWATDRLAEWRKVEAGRVVIVEGVYSTRPELRSCFGVTVYVVTPREQRLERMSRRDHDDLSWVEQWMAAEDWYEENERPEDQVDLVLYGS
jgi:uridine kinase